MGILEREPPRQDGWAATRWSVVLGLGGRGERAWGDSWDYLARTYAVPMERYVAKALARARRSAAAAHEASDVVQAFLTTCVEKGWLSRADPLRGRFRAYVQVLLRRFTKDLFAREATQKRSPQPGRTTLCVHDLDLPDDSQDYDRSEGEDFSRSWVRIAVDRAMQRLGEEHERYRVVIADLIATDGNGSPDLAQRVGLEPEQLAVLRHRSRKRFGRLFEEELAQTVGSRADFEEEWRAIRPFLPPGL